MHFSEKFPQEAIKKSLIIRQAEYDGGRKGGGRRAEDGERMVIEKSNSCGGYHGTLEIVRAYNEDFISIIAMEGEMPILDQITVVASSKWILDRLTVIQDDAAEPLQLTLLEIQKHNWSGPTFEIIVRNSSFFSTVNSAQWTRKDCNSKACNGAYLTGDYILLENNHFANVNFGITVSGNFTDVISNVIENFAGDGLRGPGQNIVFRGNVVTNCYDVNENHDDGFQSW